MIFTANLKDKPLLLNKVSDISLMVPYLKKYTQRTSKILKGVIIITSNSLLAHKIFKSLN